MADLDKLHKTYKDARLKYLNVRRDAEEALVDEMVSRLKLLEEAAAEPLDRMAKARAARAAKREAEAAAAEADKAAGIAATKRAVAMAAAGAA
jgi:hypothetical protein